MVYTSYFGKMRSFPCNIFPIAICNKIPDWYKGLWYKKLAPRQDFLNIWRQTHDSDYYINNYNNLILNNLNAHKVAIDIQLMLPYETREKMENNIWINEDIHVALLCYEKSGDFCHRTLVSAWLNKNGYKCEEWK